jgi:hypothetical protein
MISTHTTPSVQRIYDELVATLSTADRMRLIELITQSMAEPALATESVKPNEIPLSALPQLPGWHINERRGGEWRDRAL